MDLVEGETFWTYPGVSRAVLAIVEDLAIQAIVSVIARGSTATVELAVR